MSDFLSNSLNITKNSDNESPENVPMILSSSKNVAKTKYSIKNISIIPSCSKNAAKMTSVHELFDPSLDEINFDQLEKVFLEAV